MLLRADKVLLMYQCNNSACVIKGTKKFETLHLSVCWLYINTKKDVKWVRMGSLTYFQICQIHWNRMPLSLSNCFIDTGGFFVWQLHIATQWFYNLCHRCWKLAARRSCDQEEETVQNVAHFMREMTAVLVLISVKWSFRMLHNSFVQHGLKLQKFPVFDTHM